MADTLAAHVAATIRTAIRTGALPAGGRLPPETALAAEHQVSRDTIRRALAVLDDEGVTVVRSRRRYVTSPVGVPDLAWERVAADLTTQHARRAPVLLPGEHQLAATYGVSRITVRRALIHLQGEGIAWPHPRVGWYIGRRPRA